MRVRLFVLRLPSNHRHADARLVMVFASVVSGASSVINEAGQRVQPLRYTTGHRNSNVVSEWPERLLLEF